MRGSRVDRLLLILQRVALIALACLFLLQVFNSLDWRMEHDTPLLHYAAFMMDEHHKMPYRDIFETSMPGTFLFHLLVGKLFGYGDGAFRLVDLGLLGVLLAATFLFMVRFGRLTALWAVLTFGLIYFSHGQSMSLQRDYLGVIPVGLALLCIPARDAVIAGYLRFALVGFLYGLAALVKPHLAMTMPAVGVALLGFRRMIGRPTAVDSLKCAAVCGAAFMAPLAGAAVWLMLGSAWGPFLQIVREYIPLHGALTGAHTILPPGQRAFYLLESTLKFGGYGVLMVCALFGYSRVLAYLGEGKALRWSLASVFLCTLLYAVYPTLAGKFWDYHYMPFAYFCAVSVGLCLFSWPMASAARSHQKLQDTIALLALLVAVTLQLGLPTLASAAQQELRAGREAHAPNGGRADEIAAYLQTRLRPGDTVQPLDWTGGAIHAMLIAKAPLATRFMYDYHFHHHVSFPYTRELRRSFIDQLQTAKPRFVIAVVSGRPRVTGVDSNRTFPELQQFLDRYYSRAHRGAGYTIYERRTGV